jgi:hypothetical protein
MHRGDRYHRMHDSEMENLKRELLGRRGIQRLATIDPVEQSRIYGTTRRRIRGQIIQLLNIGKSYLEELETKFSASVDVTKLGQREIDGVLEGASAMEDLKAEYLTVSSELKTYIDTISLDTAEDLAGLEDLVRHVFVIIETLIAKVEGDDAFVRAATDGKAAELADAQIQLERAATIGGKRKKSKRKTRRKKRKNSKKKKKKRKTRKKR